MHRLKKTSGFTLIELLIVVAIIGIIAAVAVPGLLRARMSANETSAIGSLRAIWSAQATYAFVCGRSHYATALPILAVPPGGVGLPFLSPDMTTGLTVTKSGYRVELTDASSPSAGADCNGTATATGYYASAAPAILGSSGSRSFAVDQMGTIFFLNGGTAPDPPNAGTPIQ